MDVEYSKFLEAKNIAISYYGKDINVDQINKILFPFQKDVTRWAIKKGRAAIFLDTGLGKTFCQLEWARLIGARTLIIAPLSVARQTVREGKKINIDIKYVRSQDDITDDYNIYITNYEIIDCFDFSMFQAVVLDESSILKCLSGKIRRRLTELCSKIPYRLACTATPAPNDNTEIGTHAEFLGICTHAEMLAQFFVNANREHTFIVGNRTYRKKGSNKGGTEWRLKHHAEKPFFKWLSAWAISMIQPSDLGYEDEGFILPKLEIIPHFAQSDYVPDGSLFFTSLRGISDRAKIRRSTINARLEILKEVVNNSSDQWIIWAGLDEESRAIKNNFGAIEVKGSDSSDYKAQTFEDFQDGKIKIMVTKPRIGGFGMNFQNAHRMAFFGLSDSWESWYQCIRRQWRYGQKQAVDVHVILSDIEQAIYTNIQRKDAMAKRLRVGLIEHLKNYELEELSLMTTQKVDYKETVEMGNGWKAFLGDACECLKKVDENTIDLSVYSPPFVDLFTYTDSNRDLGNSRNREQFFSHYSFIIKEILRVTKPGRITCVHTSDIPAMAQRDGYIGVKDFPGDVIRAYGNEGWIFVGRAFVQKNPQAQAIRTKSKALLFVQMRKDSSDSRPALVDQILMFKKDGENKIPICPVDNGELDNEKWIEWANGIWIGIHESDTLQYHTARDKDDEKHICPLQLGTIERCIKLYSNPGETILTPFGGIGSEAYQAIKLKRKAILIELKESYYRVAIKNMKAAELLAYPVDLFSINMEVK